MILIPISTDAPIYHRPIGTGLLILINVLVYLATGNDLDGAIDAYGLHHGAGFTPVQWLTSNFIHGGFFHILLNMIFLWGFGIIVEGKIGWYLFIPLYLGIGMAECLIEQAIFFNSVGVSFGASAIIYGLMAISLVWSPQNELTVFYWLFFRFFGVFDISIVGFAALNLFISFMFMLILFLANFPMNSEALHLLGAGIGALIGVFLLKSKLVDCEGWDIFAVMRGTTPSSEPYLSHEFQAARRRRQNMRKANRERPAKPHKRINPGKASPERFAKYVSEKKTTAAYAELERLRHKDAEWSPNLEQLLLLARGLRTASKMKDAVKIYKEFIEKKPDYTLACLELAEIFVFVEDKPTGAMKLLDRCRVDTFNENQQKRHRQAVQHAKAMIADGVIEIDFQS